MKSSNAPTRKCAHCDGTGEIALSNELTEALGAVRALKRATALTVRDKLDPWHKLHPTAFNNRLNDLVRVGLLKRMKNGKTGIYEVAS